VCVCVPVCLCVCVCACVRVSVCAYMRERARACAYARASACCTACAGGCHDGPNASGVRTIRMFSSFLEIVGIASELIGVPHSISDAPPACKRAAPQLRSHAGQCSCAPAAPPEASRYMMLPTPSALCGCAGGLCSPRERAHRAAAALGIRDVRERAIASIDRVRQPMQSQCLRLQSDSRLL
jgi:hypothetical protein